MVGKRRIEDKFRRVIGKWHGYALTFEIGESRDLIVARYHIEKAIGHYAGQFQAKTARMEICRRRCRHHHGSHGSGRQARPHFIGRAPDPKLHLICDVAQQAFANSIGQRDRWSGRRAEEDELVEGGSACPCVEEGKGKGRCDASA